MYYINREPNENGNYGNPQSTLFPNSLALSDTFLDAYVTARGFVNLTIEDGTITAMEVNQPALNAYLAEYPDVPEQETPTQLDRIEAQAMYTALMTDTLLEED